MDKGKETLIIITTSKNQTLTNSNTTNASSILYLNLSTKSSNITSSTSNNIGNKSTTSTTSCTILNSTICPKLNQGIISLSHIPSNNNDNYYLSLSSSSSSSTTASNNNASSSILNLCSTATSNTLWKSYIADVPLTKIITIPYYNYVIGGDKYGKIHVWNITSGHKINDFSVHNRRITSLDCTIDNNFILSGSDDGMVCLSGINDLFNNKNSNNNDIVRHSWCEHTLAITQVACCSSSTNIAVSVGKDALIVIMELQSKSTLARILLPTPATCVQIDDMHDKLYVGAKNGKIYDVNISSYSSAKYQQSIIKLHPSSSNEHEQQQQQETVSELVKGQQHEYEITCLKLLKDSNILISGDKYGHIRLWDIHELCTIKLLQPWNNTDANSICRISNIVQIPTTTSTSNNNTNESSSAVLPTPLPQPFQRYAKDDDTLLLLPSSFTTITNNKRKNYFNNYKNNEKYYKLLKQCNEFYTRVEKEQQSNNNTAKTVVDNNQETEETINVLQNELKDAKCTIERWEKVNKKLMLKLNKLMK